MALRIQVKHQFNFPGKTDFYIGLTTTLIVIAMVEVSVFWKCGG